MIMLNHADIIEFPVVCTKPLYRMLIGSLRNASEIHGIESTAGDRCGERERARWDEKSQHPASTTELQKHPPKNIIIS